MSFADVLLKMYGISLYKDLIPALFILRISLAPAMIRSLSVSHLFHRPTFGLIFKVCALKSRFFLKNSTLLEHYLTDFYSLSKLGLGIVQLKYQRAKRLKFSFLVL